MTTTIPSTPMPIRQTSTLPTPDTIAIDRTGPIVDEHRRFHRTPPGEQVTADGSGPCAGDRAHTDPVVDLTSRCPPYPASVEHRHGHRRRPWGIFRDLSLRFTFDISLSGRLDLVGQYPLTYWRAAMPSSASRVTTRRVRHDTVHPRLTSSVHSGFDRRLRQSSLRHVETPRSSVPHADSPNST